MSLANSVAYRVSSWNRKRKWELFWSKIRPGSETRILDVGFQDASYQPADNFIEEHYPWTERITALGIEEPTNFSRRYPDVEVVVYDGWDFPFEDKSFDVIWSNAVVEHVGDRESQLKFLSECHRVGERVFLTTPNRWFPVEVHTRLPLLHWLPKRQFDKILVRIGKAHFAGDYMNLLSRSEFRELLDEAGLRDADIRTNRLLGLSLDFVAIR